MRIRHVRVWADIRVPPYGQRFGVPAAHFGTFDRNDTVRLKGLLHSAEDRRLDDFPRIIGQLCYSLGQLFSRLASERDGVLELLNHGEDIHFRVVCERLHRSDLGEGELRQPWDSGSTLGLFALVDCAAAIQRDLEGMAARAVSPVDRLERPSCDEVASAHFHFVVDGIHLLVEAGHLDVSSGIRHLKVEQSPFPFGVRVIALRLRHHPAADSPSILVRI
mmetsp:Transcript_4996/g.12714  ORF Transcript_4996/g.12714 Transcript_4996/m.12714 type:complete len:220 (+) Transcript_4996:1103-1762(+)